ncbi:MAG: benzoate-CoA ligase family protein [Planctomycetes bacterium]|nr:benzoate-CoA ligase family protein [Planctomycetota bacterium]
MLDPIPDQFNLSDYYLDHNLREGRADKVAVVYRDEKWTYRQIHEGACRAAGALRSVGVRQEDRVLLILPDCPSFVTALFGIHKAGAVLCMANPLLPVEDFVYYFNYTRAVTAVVHHSLVEGLAKLRPQMRHLKNLLVAGGDPGPFLSYEKTCVEQPAFCENAPTHKDDPAVWLFTSGSTGKPKACMHLQHDFAWNTERYAKGVLGMTETDRTIGVPKLFFGYATGTNLWFPFSVGGSTVLFEERASPEVLFSLIAQHRPTVLTNVPTTINKMLEDPAGKDADLSCLRISVSAGEALPGELYDRWRKRFSVDILDGIGSAEMFHIYISGRIGEVRPGSLGTIVPGYEAKICGPDGDTLPDGEIGTLWISGDSAMTGFWQDDERSRKLLHGNWYCTGDQLRRDKDGYFWYEGRADDMLKIGGIWVSPLEVENCLLGHPSVKECCVVGVKDENGLVLPKAFVVTNAGARQDEAQKAALIEHVKSKLVRYKAPRFVEWMEALPRNDRGKIERKKLSGG